MSGYAHLGVVGAGAWGTALAMVAARAGARVTLWARREEVVAEIATIRSRAQEYEQSPELVRGILEEGCERARATARETMNDVREAMGLEYR